MKSISRWKRPFWKPSGWPTPFANPAPGLENISFVPTWSQCLQDEPAGLSLAREKGWLLAWDKSHWVYFLNQSGQIQGQVHFPEPIVDAALAETGSGALVVGGQGKIRWLAPDLT